MKCNTWLKCLIQLQNRETPQHPSSLIYYHVGKATYARGQILVNLSHKRLKGKFYNKYIFNLCKFITNVSLSGTLRVELPNQYHQIAPSLPWFTFQQVPTGCKKCLKDFDRVKLHQIFDIILHLLHFHKPFKGTFMQS